MFYRKLLTNSNYLRLSSKRLISNEFKKVLNTRFENPAGINPTQMQLAVITKNVNALNLDLFINNLNEYDERRSAVLELVAALRASKLTQDTLDSTHFATVRFLLENHTMQELLPIVTDRVKYGIFLDNFTAFAILETAHQEKEHLLALPLAMKLILYEEVDSLFIEMFCIKSCLMTLKQEMDKEPAKEEPEEKNSGDQKKVRVKFLRNPLIIDQHVEMSKVILKIQPKLTKDTIKDNAHLLGIILSKRYDNDLSNIMASKQFVLYEDVYTTCREFLKRQNQTELATQLESFAGRYLIKQTLDEELDKALQILSETEEPKLIEHQMGLFKEWQKKRELLKQRLDKEREEEERKANVEQIMKELKEKEQKLWFFENEEEIDLQIYNKQASTGKDRKWLGKKKKPRTMDENYVPPEIRRIN